MVKDWWEKDESFCLWCWFDDMIAITYLVYISEAAGSDVLMCHHSTSLLVFYSHRENVRLLWDLKIFNGLMSSPLLLKSLIFLDTGVDLGGLHAPPFFEQ